MAGPAIAISPEERTLAALTHLSGLAGYVIPLGGVIVPIILWVVKKDSQVISSIAKQALLLNFAAYVLLGASLILFFTVVLIPVVILIWALVGFSAIALPIVGAVKAADGTYYRYPMIGIAPAQV